MRNRNHCQTEHPLYASGDTVRVLALSVAATARDYRQQPIHISYAGDEVVVPGRTRCIS